jgi:hypothetical protein
MKRSMDTNNIDVEQECETWDWARTAGLSAQDLREAVLESLTEGLNFGYELPKAA